MRENAAQPLTGADRFALYSESAVQPMHTLKALILDPRGGDSPATPEAVYWAVERARSHTAVRPGGEDGSAAGPAPEPRRAEPAVTHA